ncbi:MAG TPA: hypothetical protein DDZ76_13315 [Xanthomonadales bacterium]|nr:hypothetical protein [Xanthomonadales bacterium]
MSHAIDNLAALITDERDGREFRSRNFVAHGREPLLREIRGESACQSGAEGGGYLVASNIEQIDEQVRETDSFHPSFEHLAVAA